MYWADQKAREDRGAVPPIWAIAEVFAMSIVFLLLLAVTAPPVWAAIVCGTMTVLGAFAAGMAFGIRCARG